MAELFGFEIKRKGQEDLGSFVNRQEDDGAVVVAEGGAYGQYIDLEQTSKTEGELVTRYRKMAMQPECENAIDDVVNESIVYDSDSHTCELNLDKVQVNPAIKEKIQSEFLSRNIPTPLEMVGVDDRFGESGGTSELMSHLNIDSKAIENAVKAVIKRK